MQEDVYRLAEARFRSVIASSPEEREDLLARADSDDPGVGALLRRMVDADLRAPVWLDQTGLGDFADSAEPRPDAGEDGVGAQLPAIPGFEILDKIAEGGMGVVYRARQLAPRRDVAIKLIRSQLVARGPLGAALLAREGETLGMLHHPGIATVHAALGGPGHPPCFVMEYVRGQDLVGFARSRGASARDRVRLLARISEAIGHAHMLGVVHRDLKPSNVLVGDDGAPKILDFGIAKIVGAVRPAGEATVTAAGVIGTLPYMAPEQIGAMVGDVSPRADVHALGVMLFEVISGELPYPGVRGQPLASALHAFVTGEPRRLRSVMPRHDASVPGRHAWRDLESIIARALAKSPASRYADGNDLAEDLRRWLDGTAVSARPETALGRATRFASRNRAVVASLCAAVLAMLIGTALSVTFGARERAARYDAQSSAATSDGVERFLRDTFEMIDPEVAQTEDTTLLRQMLERAGARLETDLSDQPLARARLLGVFGWVYERLGLLDPAIDNLTQADALYTSLKLEQTVDAFTAADRLQLALREAHRIDEAQRVSARALAIASKICRENDDMMLGARAQAARNIDLAGRTSEALPELKAVSEAARAHLLPSSSNRLHADVFYAHALMRLARHAEAEPILVSTVETASQHLGKDNPTVHLAIGYLAGLYLETGRPALALPLLERSLAYREAIYGPDHARTLSTKSVLTSVLYRLGKFEEAERIARQVLAAREKDLPEDHPLLALTKSQLGQALVKQGDFDEALGLFQDALRIAHASTPNDLKAVTDPAIDLGTCLCSMGRMTEGIAQLRSTYENHAAATSPAHGVSVHIAREIARAYEHLGDLDDASVWRAAAEQKRYPDGWPDTP